jgi:cell division protein FtsQ
VSAARAVVGGHFVVKMAAWLAAVVVIVLPVVAVVNGWIGAGQWPFRQLRVDADFRKVDVEAVRAAIAPTLAPGFFAVDLDAARAAVERLPWVAGAEVRKRWPDIIEVRVREFEAAARWNGDRLLDVEGRIFDVPGDEAIDGLPGLHGPDERATDVLALWRALAPRLSAASLAPAEVRLSPRGSVEVELADGSVIRLGRDLELTRLNRFLDALPEAQPPRPGMRWTRADLRYANGFALTWRPAASPTPSPAADSGRPAPDPATAAPTDADT